MVHAFGKIVQELCNLLEGNTIIRDALLNAPVIESLIVNESNKMVVGMKK